jgi:hypothetical protein
VSGLGVGLADAQTQRQFSIQLGVREKEIAAAIQPIHDGLIRRVSGFVAEADQVQRGGGSEFEVLVVAHPASELLRQFDVAADVVLQAFHAVVANNKPELKRAETAAELDVPIAIIDYRARFRGLVAQVFRQDA